MGAKEIVGCRLFEESKLGIVHRSAPLFIFALNTQPWDRKITLSATGYFGFNHEICVICFVVKNRKPKKKKANEEKAAYPDETLEREVSVLY